MAEFEKIGKHIEITSMIIHKVTKQAGNKHTTIKIADATIEFGEREKLFIGTVFRSYFDKSKPIYGIFANEYPKFKQELQGYRNGKKDMLGFSVASTEAYKSVIQTSAPATGGFLIFAHFKHTQKGNDYMLVMTITNKDGFVVNEKDLTLKDIKNIDLSKIDVACMINLTKWDLFEEGKDENILTYLSFARGNKDVSSYFLTFIDCDNKTTKAEATNRLNNALESYYDEKEFDRDEKIRLRNQVSRYCIDCIDLNKEIQLSAISALINPEDPDEFESYASDEVFGVSSIINGDKNKFKFMGYVVYKDEKMRIEFDADLLRTDNVIYDAEAKRLTFNNLPDELIKKIPLS